MFTFKTQNFESKSQNVVLLSHNFDFTSPTFVLKSQNFDFKIRIFNFLTYCRGVASIIIVVRRRRPLAARSRNSSDNFFSYFTETIVSISPDTTIFILIESS